MSVRFNVGDAHPTIRCGECGSHMVLRKTEKFGGHSHVPARER